MLATSVLLLSPVVAVVEVVNDAASNSMTESLVSVYHLVLSTPVENR